MATPDIPSSSSVDVTPEESPAQRQARLRRERRQAKIQEGGSDRLNKITSLGGRPAAAEDDLTQRRAVSPPKPPSSSGNASVEDPAEVDLSKMFEKPQDDGSPQEQQKELLRQMLSATGPPRGSQPDADQNGIPEDPIARMMQQLLGAGGPGGQGSEGLPPGLANLFSGQQEQEPEGNADNLWRIVHAIVALLMGLYMAVWTGFDGSVFSRRLKDTEDTTSPILFLVFATTELVLQSGRYLMDGGKLPRSGILRSIAQFLPEPYANYVRVLGRYSIIYTTIMSDVMIILFVLGFVAWWKGAAVR